MPDPDPQPIDPSQIRPGPIRHGALPKELLDQIRSVYELIGPYLGQNLEQFEIGFMRDMNPESEVAIWRCIVRAWNRYHVKYLRSKRQSIGEEKKLVGALIVISAGGGVEQLGVPTEVGERLMACYEGREL